MLRKTASGCTPLTRDSDWYENRVTVEDPSPFRPGCGIMLRSYADGGGLREVVRDTVVDVDGSELTLSRRLLKNFWLEHRATAATLFPVVTAEEGVCDVTVEDLVLDGNHDENEEINGNYAGAGPSSSSATAGASAASPPAATTATASASRSATT